MLPAEPPKPTYSAAPAQRKAGSSKAMKLGGKNKDVDSFVDQVSGGIYLSLEFEITIHCECKAWFLDLHALGSLNRASNG